MRSLIIDGVDTYANLGLRLLSSTLSPPEPKTYVVDIPGGNGSIDITEALAGDVVYSNRQQEFTFATLQPREFEVLKTRVSNLLHGRKLGYRLSWDPGYSYEGRFSVSSYELAPGIGRIVVKVDADPYKTKGLMTYRLNANGGAVLRLESGRKSVRPIIETKVGAIVDLDGVTYEIPPGSILLRNAVLREGVNEIVINTNPSYGVATWADYDGSWADLGDARLSDLAAGDSPLQESVMWTELTGTWEDIGNVSWQELVHPTNPDDDTYDAYVAYEWSDL